MDGGGRDTKRMLPQKRQISMRQHHDAPPVAGCAVAASAAGHTLVDIHDAAPAGLG
jgi:hypothetical protein